MPKTDQTEPQPSALERLEAGVSALLSSGAWKAALEAQRRFYHYSFRNVMLIFAQCPEATRVAGYTVWKSLGRQVKKGEKGLCILAPLIRKDASGNKSVYVVRNAYVYDLSQTEGDDLMETPELVQLEGEFSQLSVFQGRLEAWLKGQNIALERVPLPEGVNGMYQSREHRITLSSTLSPNGAFKTLIHEVAHALLHREATERTQAELEAESCAYLVCAELGLDTGSYSFAYLADWTPSVQAVLEAGQKAAVAAKQILAVMLPPALQSEQEEAA